MTLFFRSIYSFFCIQGYYGNSDICVISNGNFEDKICDEKRDWIHSKKDGVNHSEQQGLYGHFQLVWLLRWWGIIQQKMNYYYQFRMEINCKGFNQKGHIGYFIWFYYHKGFLVWWRYFLQISHICLPFMFKIYILIC